MGVITQGILGGFSGKVGTVIGGSWKGIDYMRSKAASITNPRTPAQLDQRSKFSTALSFLQPLTPFLRTGFKGYAIRMSAFNAAMSYTLRNAITGIYPDYTIDYSFALVTRGSLAPALNSVASSSVAGTVSFEWDDNSGEGNALTTDKSLLVVFNPTKNEAIYIMDGASRLAGTHDVTVPGSYSGDVVHPFIGFISEDGTSISNSKYLGSVTVA